MTLRIKLILSFLFVSVITVLAVGITAWWLVMRDFQQARENQAFTNFQQDITAYISRYGSWKNATQAEDFRHFAMQRHRFNPPIMRPEQPHNSQPHIMRSTPPFHFLLVSVSGKVLRATDNYHLNDHVDKSVMEKGHPISINNEVVLYAIPISEPILSEEDKIYLNYLKETLFIGIGLASVLALLLGFILGRRLVSNLEALIIALRNLKPDGEIPEKLIVKSRDEIGQLAETYNQMSESLSKAHKELHELSIRDPLTSLYNRRYFEEHANNMFKHSQRYDESLCVMITDIDHFKLVNDEFSHSIGDLVIQRTAKILSTHIRDSDLLARYGGEEFIIVFANTDMQKAYDRCELLRQRVENEPWHLIEPELKVTISLGLSDNSQRPSVEEMIKLADDRLYIAKENGRNRIEPAA